MAPALSGLQCELVKKQPRKGGEAFPLVVRYPPDVEVCLQDVLQSANHEALLSGMRFSERN